MCKFAPVTKNVLIVIQFKIRHQTLLKGVILPGSDRGYAKNGMTTEMDTNAATRNPAHQAPTHVGSAGVISILYKKKIQMKVDYNFACQEKLGSEVWKISIFFYRWQSTS